MLREQEERSVGGQLFCGAGAWRPQTLQALRSSHSPPTREISLYEPPWGARQGLGLSRRWGAFGSCPASPQTYWALGDQEPVSLMMAQTWALLLDSHTH